MTEPTDIAQPIAVPNGAAADHARGLSMGMGALAGGTAGAILGAVWGMAGKQNIVVRSATLAAIGGLAGTFLSAHTWHTPPHSLAATAPHAAKLDAERGASADISQAL